VTGSPGDDDIERAARCALAMQRAMALLNEEQRALGQIELAMGIGVNDGPVAAGTIGSPDRVKCGVVGPAVNLAARIQALAAGGEVLLSETAFARLGGSAQVGAPRRTLVKGFGQPITVYPLLGFPGDASPEATTEDWGTPDARLVRR
jgi:adenylate cyclase